MSETIDEAAARWFAAQDSDDMDWDAFTAWLEADPRHRAAFDALALLDADVAQHRELLAVRHDENVEPLHSPGSRRWLWGGGVVAAAAALAVALSLPHARARRDLGKRRNPTQRVAAGRHRGGARPAQAG